MSISQVRVVSVPVSDQDRAKAFYVDALGFDVRKDGAFGQDQRWVELGVPGSPTTITLVTWFPTMLAGSLKGLVLECDDVEATHDELKSRGVQFSGPVQTAFWGTFVTFDDPDGNGWVLSQSSA